MTTKIVSSLFFNNKKDLGGFHDSMGCQPSIKTIDWFSRAARDESLDKESVIQALCKLNDFIAQKESEKEDLRAELQLAYAFQEKLEERQAELSESVSCRR